MRSSFFENGVPQRHAMKMYRETQHYTQITNNPGHTQIKETDWAGYTYTEGAGGGKRA